MKTFFKYGILAWIAFCLNLEMTELITMCQTDLSTTTISGQQFISQQPQTTRQAINKLYEHCANMPCDIVHYSKDVPTAKYIVRQTNYSDRFCTEQLSRNNVYSNISLHQFYDPVSYYVFGLRKIII